MTANHIYLQAKRAEGLTLPLYLQMAEGPDVIVHIVMKGPPAPGRTYCLL